MRLAHHPRVAPRRGGHPFAAVALATLAAAAVGGAAGWLLASADQAPARSLAEAPAGAASADGDVVVPDAPTETTRRVGAPRASRPTTPDSAADAPSSVATAPIESPRGSVAATPSAPRILRLVDDRGAPIRDDVLSGDDPVVTRVDRDGPHEIVVRGDLTIAVLARDPDLDVVVIDGLTGVPVAGAAQTATTVVVRPDEWRGEPAGSVALHVDPPPGYGGFDEVTWTGPVARRTERARITVPVYPATTLAVRVLDQRRRTVRGATVTSATTSAAAFLHDDEHGITWRASSSGRDGVVLVTDLPRIPFAPLVVAVRGTVRSWGRSADLFATVGGLRLDATPAAPVDAVLSNGGFYRGPCGDVPH